MLSIALFEDYKSCVVNLMLDSFKDYSPIIELKDISLAEWNIIKLLLKRKILESHLSKELLIKASRFGFTNDAAYYFEQDKKHSLNKKTVDLELFLSGHGNNIFFVDKNKYHILKTMLPSNITPVVILVEDNNIVRECL